MKFCTECHLTVSDEETLCPVASCRGLLRREPLLGQLLDGRYEISGVQGSGGVGVLLRARHTLLNTPVAVKVLDLRDADPEIAADMARRFRTEATLIAKLRHPSIVEVSDFGVADDGRSYIVMEFLEGKDLESEIWSSAPIAMERIEWVMDQVCDALSWTHEHGVIHRDVKPANIMLTRLGGEECVKLLDFGVAKILAEGPSLASQANIVVGTPEYMAPEQIQPNIGPVGPATDIYALAITVYEMLAGVTPFHHDTFLRICQAKFAERALPLSAHFLESDSEALQDVIDRALRREPEERYQDVSSFMSALRAALRKTALSAPSPQSPRIESIAPTSDGVEVRPILQISDHGSGDEGGFSARQTVSDFTRSDTLGATRDFCEACLSPLEPGEVLCATCGAIVGARETRDPFIGAIVDGRYRIDASLRLEIEGLTYRATEFSNDRSVVLSLIPTGSPETTELTERLISESERSRLLRQKGLAATIDGGFDAGLHVAYIVAELIEGPTLVEEMELCGLAELEAVQRRLSMILETLEFLHAEGIIYGALEPSNVVVVNDASEGERIVLRDLARARRAIEMSTMVTLGRFGGPQFSPPEQVWSGRAESVSVDVYAAGALAYYCLTGKPPYAAESPQEVLTRLRAGRLESPRLLRPERVDEDWERLVLRAMSYTPEDRFSTISEMLEEVRGLS